MTINDDDDFIQEMRLVAKMHRPPGMYEPDLSSRDVLRMATINGRKAVLFDDVGVLRAGGPADVVTMRLHGMLDQLHAPGFDPVDLLLYRGRREYIDNVLVAGEMLLDGGKLTRVSKELALGELRAEAERHAGVTNTEIRRLMNELRPHVLNFYDSWFRDRGTPYYFFNSRT
jgi:cytosine/adenosine deaminase-related metal-dependent hydrolase